MVSDDNEELEQDVLLGSLSKVYFVIVDGSYQLVQGYDNLDISQQFKQLDVCLPEDVLQEKVQLAETVKYILVLFPFDYPFEFL